MVTTLLCNAALKCVPNYRHNQPMEEVTMLVPVRITQCVTPKYAFPIRISDGQHCEQKNACIMLTDDVFKPAEIVAHRCYVIADYKPKGR